MSYYALVDASRAIRLSVVALNREHAIAQFGEELGARLTLDEQDIGAPPYMMDEWFEEGPHWVNPHIPVFREGDSP